MIDSVALLALEASDGVVVLTSITLVFGMLVALCLIITLEGKIFDSLDAKKKPATPAAPKAAPKSPTAQASAAKPAVKSAAPAEKAGISGEIIAAISAAVSTLFGSDAEITGIEEAAPRKGRHMAAGRSSRRGAWGQAGVNEQTTPFL